MKKKILNSIKKLSRPLDAINPANEEQGFGRAIRAVTSRLKSEQAPIDANRPQKMVIHGPEDVGKTTSLATFPHPLYIDAEDQTAVPVHSPAPIKPVNPTNGQPEQNL
jgi:hypothetical protein